MSNSKRSTKRSVDKVNAVITEGPFAGMTPAMVQGFSPEQIKAFTGSTPATGTASPTPSTAPSAGLNKVNALFKGKGGFKPQGSTYLSGFGARQTERQVQAAGGTFEISGGGGGRKSFLTMDRIVEIQSDPDIVKAVAMAVKLYPNK